MSQDHLVKLQCSVCKKINYYTRRNKKVVQDKLELKKYCPNCKKRTAHKEARK